MKDFLASIREAVRAALAAVKVTFKQVLKAGVWVTERVVEAVPAAASAVGSVVSAPFRALAAVARKPDHGDVGEAPEAGRLKADDEPTQAAPQTPVQTAILVRRAARARASGEPHVGLVPDGLQEWFRNLPLPAVRALSEAAVEDIRSHLDTKGGVLAGVPALDRSTKSQEQQAKEAMLNRLRLDLAAGQIKLPTASAAPTPAPETAPAQRRALKNRPTAATAPGLVMG